MAQIHNTSSTLGLRQYTKDVPPGWRPRSYPIKEYREYLEIWSRLTRLERDQIGPAIVSRLERGAYKAAMSLRFNRINPQTMVLESYKGINAISLEPTEAVYNPETGEVVIPAYDSGCNVLLNKLMELYYLDDQDLAWMSLDKFFTFHRPYDMDLSTYLSEFERLFDDAQSLGGLDVNPVGKCWLFFTRSGVPNKVQADLRLKVNGDLTKFQEMVRLLIKISKNEQASQDQSVGYRDNPVYHNDDDWHDNDWRETPWVHDDWSHYNDSWMEDDTYDDYHGDDSWDYYDDDDYS